MQEVQHKSQTMGFLSNLNKISKEIKGGYVSGQMSGAIKYTLFESKIISMTRLILPFMMVKIFISISMTHSSLEK